MTSKIPLLILPKRLASLRTTRPSGVFDRSEPDGGVDQTQPSFFVVGFMELSLMTWPELEHRLAQGACVMLPTGSTEQHGPMGLIGTDAICATHVAHTAAALCDGIVAPPIAYTPAPFNTSFPGTVSITPELFEEMLAQVCQGLLNQGFRGVFIVNGHGANLDPARSVAFSLPKGAVHIQSWWDPEPVALLRAEMFGEWEGMHATPSEIAITQAIHRVLHLEGQGIATSGDYRNFFEREGIRFSHTMNPNTGKPVTHNLSSVTVVAETTMKADALATAFLVLGPKEGFALAQREHVASLFLTVDADGVHEQATTDFAQYSDL